jgi:phage baseplate assembly protein W
MATYTGFSTQHINQPREELTRGATSTLTSFSMGPSNAKKFKVTDDMLVLQDMLNAFNIPQGQKPGRPEYGSTLWDFIFEPNTPEVQSYIEDEVRRIINQDPRIILNTISVYPNEYGIMLELELAVNPINQTKLMRIMFDRASNRATLQ